MAKKTLKLYDKEKGSTIDMQFKLVHNGDGLSVMACNPDGSLHYAGCIVDISANGVEIMNYVAKDIPLPRNKHGGIKRTNKGA